MNDTAAVLRIGLRRMGLWAEPGQSHPLSPAQQRAEIRQIVNQLDGHLLIVAYWILLLLSTMQDDAR